MAPKAKFTFERLQAIGAAAAAAMHEKVDKAILELSCKYMGVPCANGGHDAEARVTGRTQVAFEWRAVGADFDERRVVLIRCDNAAARGVSFPEMEAAFPFERLQAIGVKSAVAIRNTRGEAFSFQFSCRYIGVPCASGGHDAGARVTAHTQVAFEWRVVGADYKERRIALIRCNHAAASGVPFPAELLSALHADASTAKLYFDIRGFSVLKA